MPNAECQSPAVVLAIDPGSDKCGVALVARTGEIAHRAIVPRVDLVSTVRALIEQYQPITILCGAGTGSKQILKGLDAAAFGLTITPVDESYTSEAARARYVAENPARGLEKLLPASLRTAPGPVDDYVAVILAERYWAQQDASS